MTTEQWIAPSPDDGWKSWRNEADRILPPSETGVSSKALPHVVLLPVRTVSFSIERVFKGEEDAEYLTVITAAQAHSAGPLRDKQVDAWKIYSDEQFSYYCRVVLQKTPAEKTWIDSRFNILAKTLEAGTEIIFWKEHDRWVYGCYKDSILIHADILGTGELEPQIRGLLPLLQVHFSISGIEFVPERAVVYTTENAPTPLGEESKPFPCPVEIRTGPLEIRFQSKHLQFVPEEVEDRRNVRKSNKRKKLIGIAAAMILLLAILTLYLRLFMVQREIAGFEEDIEDHRAVVAMNNDLLGKWNELEAITSESWPLESYAAVAKALPEGQQVRLDSLEVRPGFLAVRGKSPTFGPANSFGSEIEKAPEFAGYEWTNRPPTESPAKTWDFRYEGTLNWEDRP
ncbi:hypothetical protein [Luteolibacter sp. AS25]|uniref:hypothetical protein n=1 Tax=Luteolibacter sp. AS25 TaxID=3135776 RepID=UPI00398AACD1